MRDQIEIMLTQSNRELDESWSPRKDFLPTTDVWKAEWRDYEESRQEVSDWAKVGAAYLKGELDPSTMVFVEENLHEWVASLHAASDRRSDLAGAITNQADRAQTEAADNLLEAGRQLDHATQQLKTALAEIKEVEAHSETMVDTVGLLLKIKTYAEYTQSVAGIVNSVQLEKTLKAGGELTALALSHIMPSKSFNHETVAGSVTGSIQKNMAEIGGKLTESGTQAVLVSLGVASIGELFNSVRSAHDNVRASAGRYDKANEAQSHSENVIFHSANVQDAIDDTVHLQNQGTPEIPQQEAGTTEVDTDGDGVPDMTEASPEPQPETGATQVDTDGDGAPDMTEAPPEPQQETGATQVDTDGDGAPDMTEASPELQQETGATQVDTDGDGVPDMTEASPELQQELNPLILDVTQPEAGAQTGTLAPVSPAPNFGDAGMSMLGDGADPVPDQGFSSQLTDAALSQGHQDHDPNADPDVDPNANPNIDTGADPDAGMCLPSDMGGMDSTNLDPFANQTSQLGQGDAGGQDGVAPHGLDGSDPTSNSTQNHAADGAGQSDVAPGDGGIDAGGQVDVVAPPAAG